MHVHVACACACACMTRMVAPMRLDFYPAFAACTVGGVIGGVRSASVGEQRNNIVINMPIPKPGYTLSSTKTASSNAGGSIISSSNSINDDIDDDDDDVMMGDDDVLVSPLSTTHASPAKMPATILIQ